MKRKLPLVFKLPPTQKPCKWRHFLPQKHWLADLDTSFTCRGIREEGDC